MYTKMETAFLSITWKNQYNNKPRHSQMVDNEIQIEQCPFIN